MAQAPQYSDRQRQMLRLLYLQMLQQQLAQQQMPKGQQPSTMDQVVQYAKKAKGTYDDAKNMYNAGTAAYNQLFGPTYSAATQQAWNQGAGLASQQSWNAGADAASNLSNTGSTTTPQNTGGTNWGGWVAAGLSAYNDFNKLTGDNLTDEEKALEASRAVPRAVAAYYTGGLSNMAEGFARKQWGGTAKKLDKFAMKYDPFVAMSKLWTSDKWKTEGSRLKKLIDAGIEIPEQYRSAMYQTRGRKKSELINPYLPKDFMGNTPQYGWVNNKFADSRNEADLRPDDIIGYSAFFQKYGNDWLGKFNDQERRAIAQKALDRGAVREHHGTIDVNWSPELDAEASALVGRKITPQGQPATRPPAPLPASEPATQIPVANKPQRKGILNKILPR